MLCMPSYLGGYTNTETKLDFTGQPQQSITYHKRDINSSELTTTELFTYTPQGRILTHTHQVNNNPVEVLVHNTYDALGQLVTKQVGGDETYVQNIGHLQTVDYQYNIRGWLKQINDVEDLTTTNDLFAFKINYDTPEVYGTTPLYNGNISETIWKTSSDNIHRGYGYEYDKLNRLTNAYFGTNHQINNHFNEHLSYDKNGNITTLQRTGNVDGFEQVIDDLTYDYTGNQLQSVTDADHGNQYFGFVDGNQQGNDYQYDMFGNMTQDLNKEIEEIKYNHLNLPIKITFANGNFITYIYDAIGVKVNKYVQGTSGSTSTGSYTDYLNGFQYNNNALQFFPHSEGYVKVLGNTSNPEEEVLFDYVYQYKDHLGNIRLNFTKDGESLKILEENHYYPFGLKHTYNYSKFEPILEEDEHSGLRSRRITQVPNSGYQYKYNGKEWQDELNLNLYDYHARNYDPAIGRWMNVDPLAENSRRWNPYNYAYNNPIYFIDPDGMQSQEFNGSSAFNSSSGSFSEDVEVDTMVDMGYGRVVSSRHLTGAVNFSGGDLRISGGGKSKEKLEKEKNKVGEEKSKKNEKNKKNEKKNNENNGQNLLTTAVVISQIDSPAVGPGDVLALLILSYYFIDNCLTLNEENVTTIGLYNEMNQDPNASSGGSEHTKGARKSTKSKHESGQARKAKDRGGEKGDSQRRPPQKRPTNWKGPWPPVK